MRSAKTAQPVQPVQEVKQLATDDSELAARFNRVLEATVEAMERSGVRYAFIGGIASGGLGRPRSTRDIDLFVRPEDADVTLRSLRESGFETEKTDPAWLFKGFKEGILVDVIFKSKGEIYLDQEMLRRMTTAEFHGRRLKLISPEDLLIIKAVAHSELTPGHWHDAIALLFHAHLDWDYLIQRARRAPRRVLSLLLYAQSVDIAVPNYVIRDLFDSLFGEIAMRGRTKKIKEHRATQDLSTEDRRDAELESRRLSARTEAVRHGPPLSPAENHSTVSLRMHERATKQYEVGHLRRKIAEDPRTHEIDIQIEQEGDRLLLTGRVCGSERSEAIEKLAREY
ncbi:MAG: hypothetical protein A2070_10185, partial [Bdellovibrionales bacterium GWC1_52_8]